MIKEIKERKGVCVVKAIKDVMDNNTVESRQLFAVEGKKQGKVREITASGI
jgi:hypothetical protein